MYKFGEGLIRCQNCNGGFRGKKQRDKLVYICATYSRDSSKCIRVVLKEEELIYTVTKHLSIHGKSAQKEMSEYINKIEVNKQGGYTIFYKSGDTSIINPNNPEYGIRLKY